MQSTLWRSCVFEQQHHSITSETLKLIIQVFDATPWQLCRHCSYKDESFVSDMCVASPRKDVQPMKRVRNNNCGSRLSWVWHCDSRQVTAVSILTYWQLTVHSCQLPATTISYLLTCLFCKHFPPSKAHQWWPNITENSFLFTLALMQRRHKTLRCCWSIINKSVCNP